MHRPNRRVLMILTGLSFVLFSGGMAVLHCGTAGEAVPSNASGMPVIIAHQGSAARLDRPPVPFNHDRHTVALKDEKGDACAVCHVLKETDMRLTDPEVKVFRFPKGILDPTDKTAVMSAYHNQCVSCHRTRAAEGKKTGPDIGLCGKCHVRKPESKAVTWAWQPVFNYLRHAKHVQAAEKFVPADNVNVVKHVTVVGETTGKKCETCHHTYDEAAKRVTYKKDTENSCRACHKTTDEKNARSMKQVSHAACLGCHLTLAEKVKKELVQQGRTELTYQDKKRFGPVECKGCHGERKELTPEEILKIPRLVRGQKDVMDLTLVPAEGTAIQKAPEGGAADSPPVVRMKLVPFNHKAHEPRGQFCNTCHHHSLEKCANCHTAQGDAKKGGGITYERAFHQALAKQSCAGCHDTAKESKNCAGCHQWMQTADRKSSCSVCHRGSSGGKLVEVPQAPLFQDKEKVPEKLQIKLLEKEFKPAEMPHMKIVNKLVTVSNENSLARTFHAVKDQALCSGCHHRSDLQQAAVKAPKCSTCHSRPFDPNAPGKPGVLAAYHRQCMGCHQAMHQKPVALECVKCHPAKDTVKMTGLLDPKETASK